MFERRVMVKVEKKILWELSGRQSEQKAEIRSRYYGMPTPIIHFEKSRKDSNRKLNAEELQVGKKYLEELIGVFGISQNRIYAMGRTVEKQLGYMKEAYIRYPFYGEKNDCINGIFAIS